MSSQPPQMGGAPNTGPIPMMVPPPRIPMPGNPLMRPPGIPFSPQSGGILQRPGMPIPPMPMPPVPPLAQPNLTPPITISNGPVIKVPTGDRLVSTVFVGNISDRVSDGLIRQLLMKCGRMNSWKRVQGTAGKLQAFGFCEYDDPESTLRALRLLHSMHLGGKSLMVKVDSKSRKDLVKYLVRKKKQKEGLGKEAIEKLAEEEAEKASNDTSAGALAEDLEEDTKKIDDQLRQTLSVLIQDMSGSVEDSDSVLKTNVTESINSMARQTGRIGPDESLELDENVVDRVSDEIKKFREKNKANEEKRLEELAKEKSKEGESREEYIREARSISPVRRRSRSRSRERRRGSRSRSRERRRGSRSRSRERRRGSRSRSRERRRGSRSRSRERRRGSRSRSRERRRSRSPSPRKTERDRDEEREEIRMARKRRIRQEAYDESLRNWESRERRKLRDYKYKEEREERKKLEREKDKKRMDEFLSTYDDDLHDYKYYKGSSLAEKLRDREHEVVEDEKDRAKEREELISAGYYPIEQPSEQHSQVGDAPKENSSTLAQQKPIPALEQQPPNPPIKAAFHSEYDLAPPEKPKVSIVIGTKTSSSGSAATSGQGESENRVAGTKRKTLDVFNTDEDDEHEKVAKRKPVSLPTQEEKASAPPVKEYTAEEKKKIMKNLVDSIPTSKGDLFNYQMKWDMLDETLTEKRIRPWINKKIVEYIGEEEPAVTDFIITNLKQNSSPKVLLDEISMILDDEAETFVVKLWRLLIYETEAKVLGISKIA